MPKSTTSTPWPFKLVDQNGLLAVHLVQQPVELRPVGVVADAEHADPGGQRFATGNA